MTTYITTDGQRYIAANPSDLVTQLREDSWGGAERSKKTWREEAASRASESSTATVRGDSDANFVEDLISAGLIKETGE